MYFPKQFVRAGALASVISVAIVIPSWAQDDASYADRAARNGMTEIALGALAVQKSDDYRAEHFGEMMVQHHAPAALELSRLAQANPDLILPVLPSAEQLAEIERLSGLEGDEFEDAYFAYQVMAHEKALKLFKEGAENARTAKLREFFEVMVPLMEAHLEMARSYDKALPVGG